MQKQIFLILITLLLPLKAGADVVTLRSGQIIEGMITSITEERIIISSQEEEPLGINYTSIKEVAESTGPGAQNSAYLPEVASRVAVFQQKEKQRSAKFQAQEQRRQAKAKAKSRKIEIFRPVSPGIAPDAAPAESLLAPSQPSEPKPAVAQKKVEIYTTDWCPVCRSMRSFLNSLGIKYSDYDIEKNLEARKRYGDFGASGVPVLVVDGKFIMAGFSAERVKAAVSP